MPDLQRYAADEDAMLVSPVEDVLQTMQLVNHMDYIVDSHVHFWNPDLFDYGWLKDVPALNRAFLPGDYLTTVKNVKIGKIIFVECGCDPSLARAEAEWISEIATREPRMKRIVAHAPVERGRAVRDELAVLAQLPLVKGVRRNLQGETDADYCLQKGFVEGVKALAEFKFTFDLCVVPRQLPKVMELVRRCPEICFVLDHCGKPEIRNQLFEPWASHLQSLATLPNVHCKLSGLVTEARLASWKPFDLRPFILHAIDCFGPDRVLFGGDWPVLTLAGAYSQWFEALLGAVSSLKETEMKKLFQTNAERIYRV